MKKKTVIVVDMINGFCKEGALHDKQILTIVDRIKEEVESVEAKDRIFIMDTHQENAIEFQAFPPHCIEHTSEAMVIDELLPYVEDSQCIYKNSTNAIWCMDVENLASTYDEFVITGCCSDICVLQLAISLRTYFNQKGYDKQIIVYADAIATYHMDNIHPAKEYHEFALTLMKNAGISVL